MSDKNIHKITAQLSTSMNFTCPHCNSYCDLFDADYLNDEGQLWDLINAKWTSENEKPWSNLDKEFTCPQCNGELIFDELEY